MLFLLGVRALCKLVMTLMTLPTLLTLLTDIQPFTVYPYARRRVGFDYQRE